MQNGWEIDWSFQPWYNPLWLTGIKAPTNWLTNRDITFAVDWKVVIKNQEPVRRLFSDERCQLPKSTRDQCCQLFVVVAEITLDDLTSSSWNPRPLVEFMYPVFIRLVCGATVGGSGLFFVVLVCSALLTQIVCWFAKWTAKLFAVSYQNCL